MQRIPLRCKTELSLEITLNAGQAFRWKRNNENEWVGAIGNRLYFLKESDTALLYRTHSSSPGDREALEDYFRLSVSCSDLYREWGLADPNFREKVVGVEGLRLLRQDPGEALIAFICSSNNNVTRISAMLNRMCESFGSPLGEAGGVIHYAFPTLAVLAGNKVEATLRGLGFGYRAAYVQQTAQMIMEQLGGEAWLQSLRHASYETARSDLQRLPGVGPKVADCVCLMGLDKLQAVPVDTHVLRIAERDYGLKKEGRGVSAGYYKRVGDMFHSVFGSTAGWAQAVLFAAELKRSTSGRGEGSARRKQAVV